MNWFDHRLDAATAWLTRLFATGRWVRIPIAAVSIYFWVASANAREPLTGIYYAIPASAAMWAALRR